MFFIKFAIATVSVFMISSAEACTKCDAEETQRLVNLMTISIKEVKSTEALVDACAIVYLASCAMNGKMSKKDILARVEKMCDQSSLVVQKVKE